MNAFFWSRRKSSKEIVCAVDDLLTQLFPDDNTLKACYRRMSVDTKRDRIESLDASEPECDMPPLSSSSSIATTLRSSEDDSVGGNRSSQERMSDEHHCNSSGGEDESVVAKSIPEELERHWARIRAVFHGWDDDQVDREKKMDRMAEFLLRYGIMEKVLIPKVLLSLTFETRKYVGHVFRALTVHKPKSFIEFLANRLQILTWLVDGYKNNDTALICGSMLRDCFEYECLVAAFLRELEAEFAFLFYVTTTNSNFEISADAFMNITRLLMRHKQATVSCLSESFDRVFGLLNALLGASNNYVIKRQALQLLAELLLDPVNFAVMQRYVASRSNLKRVMLLLREPSQALRMDAFHVFKIFVANPQKSHEVEQLLVRNCHKLLAFVSEFGKTESNREFQQEKALLVFTLQRMAEKVTAASPSSAEASSSSSSSAASLSMAHPVADV